MHLTNKFKVHCLKYKLANTSCISSDCFLKALTITTVFSYRKGTWEIFGSSFVMYMFFL